MFFRQLLDPETSTWTYLLADEESREAVLIDPVREQRERDLELLEQLELRLVYVIETHVHADHVTAGGLLRERTGCKLVVGAGTGVLTADRQLEDGEILTFGRVALEARATPGHTSGCLTLVCHTEGVAFTGDALLIRGCGRTDFQGGSSATLFHSVRERILSLPDETRLYPGHDYRGRTVTTVWEEKRYNPRLGGERTEREFASIMDDLDLAYPKRIDEAVPANMASGVTTPEQATPSDRKGDDWAPVLRTPTGVPVVSGEWVEAHAADVRLIDIREHIEFCGPLGHLDGAEIVPFAGLVAAASGGGWAPDEPIVTICSYGTRSGKAACMLAEAGFTRVASLHGGMSRWHDEGRPVVEVLGDRTRQDADVWRGAGI